MTYIYDTIIFFLWLLRLIMIEQENISPIEQYVIDFIRKFRLDKKLGQKDIAHILEVSRSYIGDIESPKTRAKYNMTHVDILADHFNLSPQAFFPAKSLTTGFSKKEKNIKEKLPGKKKSPKKIIISRIKK